MSAKIYFHLLFLCGILYQGIFATFSDEDNGVSSDFLVRKRRVINHLPEATTAARIQSFNYVVKIREGCHAACVGAILSHYTVITAALCIQKHVINYLVLSGGSYDHRSNFHNVTSSETYYGNPPHLTLDGIALITVDPPFDFNSEKTGYIGLHLVPLPVGTPITVVGWGFTYPIRPGPITRSRLHSITLPKMSHVECAHIYQSNAESSPTHINLQNAMAVSEKHFCTDCTQQYCARGDVGAPATVHGFLAGIHVWKAECPGRRNPDVYINLLRADYSAWINAHSLLM